MDTSKKNWWDGLSAEEVISRILSQGESLVADYRNGGYRVVMFSGGTKVRIQIEEHTPPKQPEQIDLKISDRCYLSCPFCHESSSPNGQLADIEFVKRLIDPLQPGTEIAIGGGDVFTHPQLEDFLRYANQKGFLCNLTLNETQYWLYYEELKKLAPLLYGVGYTVASCPPDYFPNLVMHFILGVHDVIDALIMCAQAKRRGIDRVFVLGYKTIGRGMEYYRLHREEIHKKIRAWREKFPMLVALGMTVGLDYRAYRQLGLSGPTLGRDGEFNMYIDAVEKTYAPTSCFRFSFPIGDRTIYQIFAHSRSLVTK